MRMASRIAFTGLAALGLAGPAAAQFGPPPGPPPPQSGPARVWNDGIFVNDSPILSADLGYGDTGGFTGVLNPRTGQLCYLLSAPEVGAPTAARIVAGGTEGGGGKTALALEAPKDGSSGACVPVKADLAKALVATPGNYVVEVDSKAYPGGAARGALSAWDGVAPVGVKAPRG